MAENDQSTILRDLPVWRDSADTARSHYHGAVREALAADLSLRQVSKALGHHTTSEVRRIRDMPLD